MNENNQDIIDEYFKEMEHCGVILNSFAMKTTIC